jgi:transposase
MGCRLPGAGASRTNVHPVGRPPPALSTEQQTALKEAVPQPLQAAGIPLANWTWKVVRQFLDTTTGVRLSRTSCLRYLHRLGFAWKRPKKRLTKADPQKRAVFVQEYVVLWPKPKQPVLPFSSFFADEAHFRADVDLRNRWVQKGQPAMVDSCSPRWGEKASYYSAVCLETGAVEVMELTGNSSSATSVLFLQQLRANHAGPLIVLWDNGPAHSGDAVRDYLATPALNLRLVRLPAYSPDYNGDEAIWTWVREEVTANVCLGTKAKVQDAVDACFHGLSERTAEVRSRCRTLLQAEAAALAEL